MHEARDFPTNAYQHITKAYMFNMNEINSWYYLDIKFEQLSNNPY